MLMVLGSCLWIGKKALQLMLMMLGSCLWIGKKALQLMLMMLGSCRWVRKNFATDAHDAGLLPLG